MAVDTDPAPTMATTDVVHETAPPPPPKSDVYIPTLKDQEILDTPDHLFHIHTWSDLRTIIAENRLEDLKRRPSDLRRYLDWGQRTREEYGSVLRYILQCRLHWSEDQLTPKNTIPFADEEDTRILFNDWPYGMAAGITHIVVWTKAEIPVDPNTGDVTADSRRIIVEYVHKIFVEELGFPAANVMWFKNWAALQSVRTLEHIHVLVNTDGIDGATDKLKMFAQ
ncbi:hypothetical protein DRE_03724 [Drechslerella stenobrocha 248]|uniref:N-acetylglucosamine-induced protein 1 n=1 Tax=Drechslerella stenobrocha 248 TaxID=1043628 RepID=W7I3L2_9PEZI|nr:hypothetical protein DRE_03724 [Drechslerella stenobrocha 248]